MSIQFQLYKNPFINVNINIAILAYQFFFINALCTPSWWKGDWKRCLSGGCKWLILGCGFYSAFRNDVGLIIIRDADIVWYALCYVKVCVVTDAIIFSFFTTDNMS